METQVLGNYDLANETIVSNVRHFDALNKTEASLQSAKDGLESDVSSDFVAMDIRQAMYQLGSITGDISSDEILGNIFSRFCIGKWVKYKNAFSFKNTLIVAYAGDLSHRTRAQFEKVTSLIKDKGIIVVNIPENWEEL